jgi:hypothetical protein
VPRIGRLLLITFVESFATVLIERGIYFYTYNRLGFTDVENLWVALGFGASYAMGALASHHLARRGTEKGLLVASLGGQFLVQVGLCAWPFPYTVVIGNAVIGLLAGLKWPLVESYVAAGLTPKDQAKVIGRFNISWAVPTALAVGAAGPLIAWRTEGLFAVAACLTVVSLILVLPLDRRAVHLPQDHPERPNLREMARYRGLLVSSRWSMLSKYSLMWILAALLPGIFKGLNVKNVIVATALAAQLDVFRSLTFLALHVWRGWHRRWEPLAWVIAGLPAGFFLAVFGPSVAVVLLGELVFGVSAGMTYYAALYYAMVVKNASVDAGGAHEGLIGAGFAVGPAAGLAGNALAPAVGGVVLGRIAGVAPVVVACVVGAVVSLVKVARTARIG